MTTATDGLLAEWTECERAGDATRLDALLADDFVGIGPVGFVLDRRAWLGRLGPDLHYDRLELDEVTAHRHGDAAIIVTHQHAAGTARGNRMPPETRLTFILVAGDDAELRIAGMQYSFIGTAEESPGLIAAPVPWKPTRLRRAADRMLSRQLRRGRGPGFIQLLTVTGRTSGLPRTRPVVPVRQDGEVWVVSPFGDVDWVRNLRAAGRLDLHRGDRRITCTARELDPAEATPVLRAYLSMPSALFVRRDFSVTKASSDHAIEAEAPRHPVFALTPVR